MIKNITALTEKKIIAINIANEIGISKTAELFDINRQTIRVWSKKYNANGIEGLQNKSRIHQKLPNKMSIKTINEIIELKSKHPKFSAKKIKEVLNLKCSLTIIYRKLKQNSHLLKTNGQNSSINYNINSFLEFFISIKKIQFNKKEQNKFPKYIILLEEKSIGLAFCSFAHERTSLSVAIFLEYFIEHINQIFSNKKYKFYLSGSIKLSQNDFITQIIKDKFKYELIPNSYISDFYPSSRKNKPYNFLYENLFSKFNLRKNNEDSFFYKTFAQLYLFNRGRINSIPSSKISTIDSFQEKTNAISYSILPIITDKFISGISKLKYDKKFFLNILSTEYNSSIQQVDQIISYLRNWGKKSEIKYQYKLAEEIFLATESIAEYYIDDISTYINKNNFEMNIHSSEHTLILTNIVSNLILSLKGLSYSFRLKGLNRKRNLYIKKGIEFSERYGLIENEIMLKNLLAAVYASTKEKIEALNLIKYIVKHPQTNKEQYFRALINIAISFYSENKINNSINVYKYILKNIGEQYTSLKIITLSNLSFIYLLSNRLDESKIHLDIAQEYANTNAITLYDTNINDDLSMYYRLQGENEEAIKHLKYSIKLSKERGDISYQNHIIGNLGSLYSSLGDYNKAISSFKSVLLSFQDTEQHSSEIPILLNISIVYLNLKKYKIADEYANRAMFLANHQKDTNQYIVSLVCKINIYIEQLDIKRISVIHDLFINMGKKIEHSYLEFTIKIINYKAEFLKLLFNYKLSKSVLSSRQKQIINIFDEINLDIKNYHEENEEKAEITFLYCRLYKYLYDNSKKQKIDIIEIEEVIKKNYILHKKESIKLFTSLYSKIPDIFYKSRLKELGEFPKIK